jgi:ubiquinone/menaquinone biosynthesis C-methylase UbiE
MELDRRQPEPELMDDAAEAAAYADADFAEVNTAFVDRLLELAADRPASLRALDLGTGPGDIPIRLVQRTDGWAVTAVDDSPAMLAIARTDLQRRSPGSSVRFVRADAKDLPLPDASFEVVFSNSILHHITDTASFWAELKRVAAPGALVFLRDLSRPATAREAAAIVAEHAGDESPLLREEFHRSLLSAYTPSEVRSQLSAAGLEELAVQPVTDRHLDIYGMVGRI